MTVQDFINLSKVTVLKQTYLKDDIPSMVSIINLGVLELHKRFPLHVEEVLITLIEGQTIYSLPTDCMWILEAYGEVPEGRSNTTAVNKLPINKENDVYSVNTISWNKIQVPLALAGEVISLIYVKKPTEITDQTLTSELDIPPQLVEALLLYVAYIGSDTFDSTAQSEDSILYQRFEASCNKVKNEYMLGVDDVDMDTRINDRGFK